MRLKIILIFAFLIFSVLLLGCGKSKVQDITATTTTIATSTVTITPEVTTTTLSTRENAMKENIIEITSSGFNPKTLTIKTGEGVTFVNKNTNAHWPASAFHPTHTVYPASGIEKCGTSEQSLIFDACKGLKQEETWSFTFNSKGDWKYHDHLNPSLFGSVIVQ